MFVGFFFEYGGSLRRGQLWVENRCRFPRMRRVHRGVVMCDVLVMREAATPMHETLGAMLWPAAFNSSQESGTRAWMQGLEGGEWRHHM